MFKEALKDVAGSLVGSTRQTMKSYNPFSGYGEGSGFERLAHAGIANISYRSPILADVATSVLQNFQEEQHKRAMIKEYVNTPGSEQLREKVKESLGADASDKKVTQQMITELRNVAAQIKEHGIHAAKETESYKKYGAEFEKVFPEYAAPEARQHIARTRFGESRVPVFGNSGSDSSDAILSQIEYNTKQIANTLDEMVMRGGLTGAGGTPGVQGKGSSGVYIDPITGLPSAKAAVSAVGSKIISNVFSEDVIERIGSKIRKIIAPEEKTEKQTSNIQAKESEVSKTVEESSEEVLKTEVSESKTETSVEVAPKVSKAKRADEMQKAFADTLSKIDLNLNSPKATTVEEQKESELVAKKESDESQSIATESLNELKKITAKTNGPEKAKSGGVVDSIMDLAKNKLLSKIPGLGGLLGGAAAGGAASSTGGIVSKGLGGILDTAKSYLPRALAAAGPAAGVLAAGGAGYAVGSALNPLIDSGLSKLTGSETSLGSYIYDLMNPTKPENRVDAAVTSTKKIEPVKKTTTEQLSNSAEKREQMEMKRLNTPPAPVVINNNTNNSVGGASRSEPAPAPIPVRNHDSTFERVQMQSFWPRVI